MFDFVTQELMETTEKNSLESLKEEMKRQRHNNEDFFIQYCNENCDDFIESLSTNNNKN